MAVTAASMLIALESRQTYFRMFVPMACAKDDPGIASASEAAELRFDRQ
jgi:hypothetical protein